jgi:RHS repeat-associated protein/uncharacterized repeat protein (TIGR01451 family)
MRGRTVISLGAPLFVHSHLFRLATAVSRVPTRLRHKRTRRIFNLFLSFAVIASFVLDPFATAWQSYGINAISAIAASTTGQASTDPGSIATSASAVSESNVSGQIAQPQLPVTVTVTPTPDPHLPSLTLHIDFSSRAVRPGEVVTATLVATNAADDPATDVVVSMPVPAGAKSVSDEQAASFTWRSPELGAHSSMTVTAVIRVAGATPPGDAILARAQVTASGLPVPIVAHGGAVLANNSGVASSANYTPGQPVVLHGSDGRTKVEFPSNASSRALTLKYDTKPGKGHTQARGKAGRKTGFEPFYLEATDGTDQDVHQFSAPVKIRFHYTPEQLQALGIMEDNLTLYWFDDSQPGGGTWTPAQTEVDSTSHTATGLVDHFTPFLWGDNSSPSTGYIPSLQGWQVNLYTGAATYQYPIEVPAGPGGMKPQLQLTYDSSATDGPGARWYLRQAGWAGKGWSLDNGYIALNRMTADKASPRYYTAVFGGKSYELVRGAKLNPAASDAGANPADWEWRTTDESFIRVRAEQYDNTTPGRAGSKGGTPYKRHKWHIWAKDGTHYTFEEDVWQGWWDSESTEYTFLEAYKWHLTRVEDTNGNFVDYKYARLSQPMTTYWNTTGTVDYSIWPTTISWGTNSQVGTISDQQKYRYQVRFVSSDRVMDTQHDYASNQLGGYNYSPQETKRLDEIHVLSNLSGTEHDPANPTSYNANSWQLVHRYMLSYETNSANYLLSDWTSANNTPTTAYPKLTLTGIRKVANTGAALPSTTFGYNVGSQRGAAKCPNPGWNRLRTADNGQGGTITYGYENICTALGNGDPNQGNPAFENNHRVKTKTLNDGMGHNYDWNYTYEGAAFNALGSVLRPQDVNQWPNSATLYLHKYYWGAGEGCAKVNGAFVDCTGSINDSPLMYQQNKEFRGHSRVVERDPNGNETEHWFYQGGEAACVPLGPDGLPAQERRILNNNQCFNDMRAYEFLRGREWKTITHAGSATGPRLSGTEEHFNVRLLDDFHGISNNNTPADPSDDYFVPTMLTFTGVWRFLSYVDQHKDRVWEKYTGDPLLKISNFTYDVDTANPYGNLVSTEELDASGVLRKTVREYTAPVNDALHYVVDRLYKETIYNGAGKYLAISVYGYDGSTGTPTLGTRGNLTLVRKYFNLYDNAASPNAHEPSATLPGTLLSTDVSYTYDNYGNKETETFYGGQGSVSSSFTNWSAPGGTDPKPKTTRTYYDQTFHKFPVKVEYPQLADGTMLVETGNWLPRLGVLQWSIDANGQSTWGHYDEWGRLQRIVKPGNNDDYYAPTLLITYDDYARPFKYHISPKDDVGTREIIKFYDGLGREIQTKSETVEDFQHSIVDKQYDGLSQLIAVSQPHLDGSTARFESYVQPDASVLWTTTQYDPQGRPTLVREPNGNESKTSYTYDLYWGMRSAVTIDAKNHSVRRYSDMFGRLKRVIEVSGTGTTSDPYIDYSYTVYSYNPLDLLTSVTDGNNQNTTIKYDSLGRKRNMSDPTMGTWYYTYYPDGKLATQKDAKNQTITFNYDNMDRLSYKDYGGGYQTRFYYDQVRAGYHNKGQRTSMKMLAPVTPGTAPNGYTSAAYFNYDVRGRLTLKQVEVPALGPQRYDITSQYDSADRLTQLTYPSGETVYYGYDAAWQQKWVCKNSNGTDCYASNAQYTETGAPKQLTFGNGLVQNYAYTLPNGLADPMKRLGQIQLGPSGSIFSRSYEYDPIGNISKITGSGSTQTFTYDHRHRLTNWTSTGSLSDSESYSYDKVGNFLTKDGASYTYKYNGTGSCQGGGPYAVCNDGTSGTTYKYDGNGNMLEGTGRTLTWNMDNQPTAVNSLDPAAADETYTYDADGERISRTVSRSGQPVATTYYLGGPYEVDQPSGIIRSLYMLNGQVVAQSSTDPDPYGNHDITTQTVVEGWACDPSNYSKPVAIHIYDGAGFLPNNANFIGAVMADRPREQAVADSCGGYPNHGFSFTLPEYRPDGTKLKDGQTHTIVAYIIGIDTEGNGNGRVVGTWNTGQQVTFTPPTPTPDPCPAQAVTWQNLVGVSASGNTLTKTAPTGWGNAGASSSKQITSGIGYVEATAGGVGTNQDGFIGLSNGDSNPNWTDVDFGLQWWYGTVYIYEGGTSRGTFGSTTAGDVFRVAVGAGISGSTVRYYKNGTLLYTSTVAPTYPLLMDVAMSGTGSTINNAFIQGCNLASAPPYTPTPTPTNTPVAAALVCEPVVWQNARYVSVVGDTITKNAGTSGAWDAGASSTRGLLSGEGYAEFTVYSTAFTPKMFGFGKDDVNWHVSDVEWAAYPHSASLYAYEGTIQTGGGNQFGPFSPSLVVGEKVRVHVAADGVVRYMRDGGTGTWTTYYTTTRPVTAAEYPLRVDTSILYLNTKLSVTLCGTNLGNVTPPGGFAAGAAGAEGTDGTEGSEGSVGSAGATTNSDKSEAAQEQITFADVPQDSAFYGYVQAAYGRGIVSGYAEGGVRTFRPSATATRGHLVKMMVLAFNLPVSTGGQNPTGATAGKQQFTDVPASHPFYSYIQAAYERGLVSGYADGTFKPEAPVTRGQLAKVAVLATGLKVGTVGEDTTTTTTNITDTLNITGSAVSKQATFSDVPAGSTFYQYVETAYAYGILHGYGDGSERMFSPDEQATRGQIVKIAYLSSQYRVQAGPSTSWANAVPNASKAQATQTPRAVARTANITATATTATTGTTRTGTPATPGKVSMGTVSSDTSKLPARTVIPFLPERQVPGSNPQNGPMSSGAATGAAPVGSDKQTNAAASAAPYAASGPSIPNAMTTVVYIHSDHLGSVSAVTDQGGNLVSSQQFDPWGKVRAGGVAQTKVNYTGQRRDDTGLLYYHARYYDPSLARFVSPDSLTPGAPSSKLAVDFHEANLAASVNGDNQYVLWKGFFSQWRGGDRWGVGDPQVLNRYSYVQNNPVAYTDPTGHGHCAQPGCGGVVRNYSSKDVWVFGTIYDPNYLITPERGGRYRQERLDEDGNPDIPDAKRPTACGEDSPHGGHPVSKKPCSYVQGWFILKAGQSTDTHLKMGDADAVRGYDEPLYDFNPQARHQDNLAVNPHGGPDGSSEVFQFTSGTEVIIADVSGKRAIVAVNPKAGQPLWEDPDVGPSIGGHYGGPLLKPEKYGWHSCTPNCIEDPLN